MAKTNKTEGAYDMTCGVINCIFANKVQGDTRIIYECGSDKSHFHMRQVCNAFCSRCKVRVPMQFDKPPVIDHVPQAKQMTVEDWLKGGTQ